MNIFIGADHGGYNLKESLVDYMSKQEIKFEDLGTFSEESIDYPDIAVKVAEAVLSVKDSLGVLLCGTGIGVSITANKIRGIRAALCHNEYTAEMARMHNNANILCLGGRVLDEETAIDILNTFIGTEFEGGRHERRVCKIMDLEKNK